MSFYGAEAAAEALFAALVVLDEAPVAAVAAAAAAFVEVEDDWPTVPIAVAVDAEDTC